MAHRGAVDRRAEPRQRHRDRHRPEHAAGCGRVDRHVAHDQLRYRGCRVRPPLRRRLHRRLRDGGRRRVAGARGPLRDRQCATGRARLRRPARATVRRRPDPPHDGHRARRAGRTARGAPVLRVDHGPHVGRHLGQGRHRPVRGRRRDRSHRQRDRRRRQHPHLRRPGPGGHLGRPRRRHDDDLRRTRRRRLLPVLRHQPTGRPPGRPDRAHRDLRQRRRRHVQLHVNIPRREDPRVRLRVAHHAGRGRQCRHVRRVRVADHGRRARPHAHPRRPAAGRHLPRHDHRQPGLEPALRDQRARHRHVGHRRAHRARNRRKQRRLPAPQVRIARRDGLDAGEPGVRCAVARRPRRCARPATRWDRRACARSRSSASTTTPASTMPPAVCSSVASAAPTRSPATTTARSSSSTAEKATTAFVIGQLYGSPRTVAAASLAAADVFATTPTTRGWLSNGNSRDIRAVGGNGNDEFVVYANRAPVTLLGDAGDDRFTLRSFALGDRDRRVRHERGRPRLRGHGRRWSAGSRSTRPTRVSRSTAAQVPTSPQSSRPNWPTTS